MCGIAGVFGREDRGTVEAMLNTIVHRGPDDGYVVGGEGFTFGVRRLSIVDLAGGRQPLCNEDQTVWAAQNGELYNFPDLRPELERGGHRFATRCDTELLPHLYEESGAEFARRLDGMFAAAVWDTRRRVGYLARDRSGKKPLYYMEHRGCVYFASEIKELLVVPGFERTLNLEAVHHFLSFKNVPGPMSIFKGIRSLPPGHYAEIRPGEPIRIAPYWKLDFTPEPALARASEEELIDQFLSLFRAGLKRRLMSDVPIGFFLSGGIDSSLSTAIAAEIAPGRVQSFTLTYDAESTTPGKDADRRWARYVAERFGTDSHEEELRFSSFPEYVRPVLRCFDEPFAGVISTYFLSRLISKHVKVAVSGDGADELFGSYLSHRLAGPLARWPEYQRTHDRALIVPFENEPDRLARLWAPLECDWREKLLVYNEEEKHALYSPDIAPTMRGFSTRDMLCDVFSRLTATDPLNRMLEAEFGTIFPDQVLAFVDRLSMAHSLEVRTAYLDTAVMEFVASLSSTWKIRGGDTKYLLKRAALRYFPHEMVYRPKEGFLMPVTKWFLSDLESYVRDTLAPGPLARHGLFDAAAVGRLIDRVYQPGADHTHVNRVLALVVFQEWYEEYM